MVTIKLLDSSFVDTYAINFGSVEDTCEEEDVEGVVLQKPLLMDAFNANEDTVIKALQCCSNQVSNSLDYSIPQTNENLLHIVHMKKRFFAKLFGHNFLRPLLSNFVKT